MKNFYAWFSAFLMVLSVSCSNGSKDSIQNYRSFTNDGAWCWFSDPRAVYYEGNHKRTYAAWISSEGDVEIGYYDHGTGEIKINVLYEMFEVDDHDVPAILFLPDGRLMVFFTKHSADYPTLQYTSTSPEDILNWDKKELFLNDSEFYKEYKSINTYVNPVLLTEENDRIYLFWRGMDNKPNYSFSDDLGNSWSKGRIYLLPDRIYSMRRPYMKVSSNGRDKIMFAFTDGHPRRESKNSIYFMYYKNNCLYNVHDDSIGVLGKLPIKPRSASVVYDAKITSNKAWVWDIAMDENEYPVVAYVNFPNDSTHIYTYSKWNGNKWITLELTNSGKWFPNTQENSIESEPNYSGGLHLDHENPNIVYISVTRGSFFEIEKWTLIDNKKWYKEVITSESSQNNVRPFAVLNAYDNNPLQVLWMENNKYIHYTNFSTSIKMNLN